MLSTFDLVPDSARRVSNWLTLRQLPRLSEDAAAGHAAQVSEAGVQQVIADKENHSGELVRALAEVGVRTVAAEPQPRLPRWAGQSAGLAAVYADRRRLGLQTVIALMKRRGGPPGRRPMTSASGRGASGGLEEMGLYPPDAKSIKTRQFEQAMAPLERR